MNLKALALTTLATLSVGCGAVEAGSTTLDWEEANANSVPAVCRVTHPNGMVATLEQNIYTTNDAIYIGDDGYDIKPNLNGGWPLVGRHTSGAPIFAEWGDGYVAIVVFGDKPGDLTSTVCEVLS